jgi:hypothetical protein
MKNKDNRKKIDTLYILGAGASYVLSYATTKNKISRKTTPLDSNFVEHILRYKPKKGWEKETTDLILNNWLDEHTHMTNNGLEQAIINRVSKYEFLHKYHARRVSKKISNSLYLLHLSHIICRDLKKCNPNSKDIVSKFINHVFPKNTNNDVSKYKNRIITFNYDIIIDKILIDEYKIPIRQLYFERIAKNQGDNSWNNLPEEEKFSHPLILKPHGSINWRCRVKDFKDLISSNPNKEKIQIWHSNVVSNPKENKFSPLIIPPIPNKPITQSSIFNYIWQSAYEYMHEAKKIVIVGYSCPNTDNLARAMFSLFANKNIKEIIVVDPDAGILKNYKEMVNPKITKKVRWGYYSGFEEYIISECK